MGNSRLLVLTSVQLLSATTHPAGSRWLVRDAPDAQPFEILIVEWSRDSDCMKYAGPSGAQSWCLNPRAFLVIGSLLDSLPAPEVISLQAAAEQKAKSAQQLDVAVAKWEAQQKKPAAQTTQTGIGMPPPKSEERREIAPLPPARVLPLRFEFGDDGSITIYADPSRYNVATFDGRESDTSKVCKKIVIAKV